MKLTSKEETKLRDAYITLNDTIEKLEMIAAFAIDVINKYEKIKSNKVAVNRITMSHFLKHANLDVRCVNALKACNFNFIDEINFDEIRKIRNIGIRSTGLIKIELRRFLKIQDENQQRNI